jgi:glycine/D-amino acid oxidase-like deaminating enzyme
VEFAKAIQSEHCKIYDATKAVEFKEGDVCTVVTESGVKVTAGHIVMATHTPKGIYFVHTSLGPYREYAVAVKLKWGISCTRNFLVYARRANIILCAPTTH